MCPEHVALVFDDKLPPVFQLADEVRIEPPERDRKTERLVVVRQVAKPRLDGGMRIDALGALELLAFSVRSASVKGRDGVGAEEVFRELVGATVFGDDL